MPAQFGGDRANKERIGETSTRLFERLARCPLPSSPRSTARRWPAGSRWRCCDDVRVAAETATFGFPEIGRFIPPSYAAAAAALPEPLARRLCLTDEARVLRGALLGG